ncbi:hypothetical protein AcetOrient_orf04013 [Acetobacter orientalis]|uniref:Uncharacterized protein n=1 Tax=Acetobacter orientalis TaxID=146474 RepID=A0A2Z5ZKN6_9PROT|nr:hypothetical protein AcetOrient_orf04013 [Acetobacter orientalis]
MKQTEQAHSHPLLWYMSLYLLFSLSLTSMRGTRHLFRDCA